MWSVLGRGRAALVAVVPTLPTQFARVSALGGSRRALACPLVVEVADSVAVDRASCDIWQISATLAAGLAAIVHVNGNVVSCAGGGKRSGTALTGFFAKKAKNKDETDGEYEARMVSEKFSAFKENPRQNVHVGRAVRALLQEPTT
jgi:hypothetical protein